MTQKQKTEWIEALRSGKYTQATGLLRRNISNSEEKVHNIIKYGYCCIEVYCEINNREFNTIGSGLKEFEGEKSTYETLNKEIFSKGIPRNFGINFLINMNDDENSSFSEIADWIEQNVPVQKETV